MVVWPVPLSLLVAANSPLGTVAGDLTTYILGYGVLGIAAVLFTMRIIVPRSAVDEAKEQARTDLLKENERLVAELARAQDQRDAAINIAQEKLVPLLTSFVATSGTLLPVLQELVAMREDLRRRYDRERDR